MKNVIILVFLFVSIKHSIAQTKQLAIKTTATKITDFVPAKWKLIAQAKGDLNKDGLEDCALVIENTNPENLLSNKDKLGGDTLNVNPRYLLVIFKKSNGIYELATKNTSFIPPANSEESPCLTDPFAENGGIEINKGLLSVHLQNFYSCGAWEVYNFDYIFRYQNQQFELIGYNKSSMHRSSEEETSKTINFSTMKMNYTSGTNAFKDDNKPKTVWKNIKPIKLLSLQTITADSLDAFD
ncbi:hypothetical protein [Pedobacter jejuensis]|uniref:Uncharacterized protein n=1 Tax=Pedobacter jejuensis TaxID=1268550 RepID=A0A3N0BP82_9SPHI|nr:hypothetical protein [Pedobacter jejuensis]RNL50707.1 hypothetical protein D7004_17595 [Pedobacter jejuensis]